MNRCRLVLGLAAIAALATACSDSGPSGPGETQNTLVFTRADQSVISFPDGAVLYAWCGPWEEGTVATPTLHVLFGGPGPGDPLWELRAVIDDVVVGTPFGFPNSFPFDQPKDVDLFVLDPGGVAPNELSTQAADSDGYIAFQRQDCPNGGEVRFSIDATIGSELGGAPSVSVVGELRTPIGSPPEAAAGIAERRARPRATGTPDSPEPMDR
jgi:hypothetical protein